MTKRILGIGILFFGVLFASVAASVWLFQTTPLLSPVHSKTVLQFFTWNPPTANQSKKVVYGFLPYWNLKNVTLQPELTTVSYFSLTFDTQGTILQRADKNGEPGYTTLQSDAFLDVLASAQKNGSDIEIVLSQFDADEIAAFLLSSPSQEKLLKQIDALLLEYPFTGINIDIEYAGTVTPNLQERFAQFIALLHQNLQNRRTPVLLSVDVFASAGSNQGIWNLPKLAPLVDYIVVMAYDFHRAASPVAGPVAPLLGGTEKWSTDIIAHIETVLTSVPNQKVLLGIPFYGYEWQTVSRSPQAQTFPHTGATASFDRIQSLLQQKTQLQVLQGWNEDALSPYLSYLKENKYYVVYYENSRSLSYKLDLVNQLHLGGIAIWALGYEKNSRELWDVIQRKLAVESVL